MKPVVMIVGMVTRKESFWGRTNEENVVRDKLRIEALSGEYDVFSMSLKSHNEDASKHLQASMTARGAKAVVSFMRAKKKKLDFILVDYVRMPSAYYDAYIVKNETNICSFLKNVQQVCRPEFKMIFARRETMKELLAYTNKFFNVNFIKGNKNPLFIATSRVGKLPGNFDHKNELQKLTNYNKKPFIEITSNIFASKRCRTPL